MSSVQSLSPVWFCKPMHYSQYIPTKVSFSFDYNVSWSPFYPKYWKKHILLHTHRPIYWYGNISEIHQKLKKKNSSPGWLAKEKNKRKKEVWKKKKAKYRTPTHAVWLSCLKQNMIKDLNVRPETIKLLEENLGRTLHDINQSKILYDPPSRVMEIKIKINKWDLIKLKKFLHSKGNYKQGEKITLRMGESDSKGNNW